MLFGLFLVSSCSNLFPRDDRGSRLYATYCQVARVFIICFLKRRISQRCVSASAETTEVYPGGAWLLQFASRDTHQRLRRTFG